jgi:uncharacterized protein (TIGR03083 family)
MIDDPAALIGEEYRNVHRALTPIGDVSWDRASLCTGWTVRHVLAHMTMAARLSPEQ